jgi:hypothetical protein
MNDYDPQVDLEIDENMIKQVVVEFGSQVNILPLGDMEMTWKTLAGSNDEFLKTSRSKIHRANWNT